ncbi:DUF5984 family protein [Streptomyces sp. IBSBF 2435]|uniref:DUF5984 family protein n=1 Tax=Streptomyces sp. IBSBF 2435 TaxID=2903531 RepID=UPI003FA6D993
MLGPVATPAVRVRFGLTPPESVRPWGRTEPELHWFGLTDGCTASTSAATRCCATPAGPHPSCGGTAPRTTRCGCGRT